MTSGERYGGSRSHETVKAVFVEPVDLNSHIDGVTVMGTFLVNTTFVDRLRARPHHGMDREEGLSKKASPPHVPHPLFLVGESC